MTIHKAGPLLGLVQRCTRCGYVLSDYRNSAWPNDQPPPSGFGEGAFIEVDEGEPFEPKFSGVTADPPTCRRLSNKGWSAGSA